MGNSDIRQSALVFCIRLDLSITASDLFKFNVWRVWKLGSRSFVKRLLSALKLYIVLLVSYESGIPIII